MKKNKVKTNEKIAYEVSIVSIIGNLFLSIFKLIAGIIGHSTAMISDAIHSSSDVISTFIVMIGIKISNKKADKKHPYGHERFECVASIILAALLFITGLSIGKDGVRTIITGQYQTLKTPTLIALIAAIISIVTKEWMFWYTRSAAKKINSSALMADAHHHRSDALSSIGALVGIAGSQMGFKVLDPIASIVISIFIIIAALEILKDSLDKMLDCSAPDEVQNQIIELAKKQKGVTDIDDLKTRLFGPKMYVDIEIAVDGNLTVEKAHKIAHNVHDEIEKNFNECKHCMVHVNPYQK